MTDLNSTLAEMREHHFPIPYVYFDASGTACAHGCSGEWPCDTDKLLGAVKAVVAILDAHFECKVAKYGCTCHHIDQRDIRRALESGLGVRD